jgi:hypothetical protein
MGFYENDRFLIGQRTTGMYFYANPNKPDDMRVLGNDINSVRDLEPGERITIPLVIEYRMADYYDENDTFIYNKAFNPVTAAGSNVLNLSTSQLTISNGSYTTTQSTSSSSQSIGIIGGYSSSNINRKDFSISYEKELGFDIYIKNGETFSFDLRASAIYGATTNNIVLDNTGTSTPGGRTTGVSVGTLSADNLIVATINNKTII